MPYPRYDQACGWQSLLIRRCPEPALGDELERDVVVVGAGYTGLAAARTWAEARPRDRIAVLDADIVGEGNPGRHAGFLQELDLAEDASAARLAGRNALIAETMARLRELVRRHDIRCQLERVGAYRVAATEHGLKQLGRYRMLLAAAGREHQVLGADALAARIGTAYYRQAVYSPDCSLVQPAALIRGLADCLPLGVQLFEETPALSVDREGDGWRVECPDGSIKAGTVLLANNAFARDLAGLRARLAVMYFYAGLTDVLSPGQLRRLGAEPNWGLLPAHRLGATVRRTADGRLLVCGFHGYERQADDAQVARRLQVSLERRFPHLGLDAERPFAQVWGGAVGCTRNGAPVWGEVGPGLWVSAGCNGDGVVTGSLFGTLLARRALGETELDVGELFGAPGRMAPQPLRQLGLAVRATLERRAAGNEG